jgi:hypothetical protein
MFGITQVLLADCKQESQTATALSRDWRQMMRYRELPLLTNFSILLKKLKILSQMRKS